MDAHALFEATAIGFEFAGVAAMAVGFVVAIGLALYAWRRQRSGRAAFRTLRESFGGVILLVANAVVQRSPDVGSVLARFQLTSRVKHSDRCGFRLEIALSLLHQRPEAFQLTAVLGSLQFEIEQLFGLSFLTSTAPASPPRTMQATWRGPSGTRTIEPGTTRIPEGTA